MKNFRPVLLKNLGLRMPGLDVLRVALNRHLRDVDVVDEHRHRFSQLLLYLTGRGRQWIGAEAHEVQAGKLFLIPAGVVHSFSKQQVRRPLCLVIDFRRPDSSETEPVPRRLTSGPLTHVRHTLSQLMQIGDDDTRDVRTASLVLHLMHQLLSACEAAEERPATPATPAASRVRRMLAGADLAELTPAAIAQATGYQRDHLNRLLKRETGVTMGQLLAEARLARAQRLLREGLPVSAAGEAVGLLDQNYFARWFRQQTGQSPSAWRHETAS